MSIQQPLRRDDFEIAIICALPFEYDAVSYLFDEFWDENGDQYGRASGDINTYTTGCIGGYSVVLALLPCIGKTNAAGTAASMRSSFCGLRLALLVGVCSGVPQNKNDEILLGDVVISSIIIEYDFGTQYSNEFIRKDTLENNHGRSNKNIRSLLATLKTDRGSELLEKRAVSFLHELQAKVAQTKHEGKYDYPGIGEDKLFKANHRHKHYKSSPNCICSGCFSDSDPVCDEAISASCTDLGCDNGGITVMERLGVKKRMERNGGATSHRTAVHIGTVASGDKEMKSSMDRDRLSKEAGVIAFDMEGAGVWDELPCLVVKGVSDYADSHKNEGWRLFAAATAAAVMKALLLRYSKTDRPKATSEVSESSLVQSFQKVVNLFAQVTAPRDPNRDTNILAARLDIEKYDLLQWAEQTNLLNTDFSEGINSPETSIKEVLAHIQHLLKDALQMEQRYGLSRFLDAQKDTPTLCTPCLRRLNITPVETEKSSDSRSQNILTEEVAHRVCQYKQKFESIIAELASHVAILKDTISPDKDYIFSKDLEDIDDLKHLEVVLEAATGRFASIAKLTREIIHRRKCKRVLDALWFRMINDRRDTITDAHHDTFKWALEPSATNHNWDDLSHWLKAGAGIYWVSGKAGSGKSTLMKYIFASGETKRLLSIWADKYTIADFFFWYLGTPIQKTQEGLSRALLHKILSHHPNHISKALPTMWSESRDGQHEISPPSFAETQNAFEVLSSSCDIGRLCLFIDGMDEYVGNYCDGIAFINSLAQSPHIKIIVSSRPIPECVAAFKHLPQLHLHDLTKPDISTYIYDKIGRHSYMEKLSEGNPYGSYQIMSDLVEMSSGVFLWVVLACRSLLSGFTHFDGIAELQSRVNELPRELEDMFQYMLNKVEPRHRNQASRFLEICYIEQEARGLSELDGMYALGLALAIDYHANPIPITVMSYEKKRKLCQDLDGRLRSRCGGLLEMRSYSKFCFCGRKHDRLVDARVFFMHRTVFEFLKNESTWKLDCLKREADDKFDAATAMSLGSLQLAMQSINEQCPRETQALSCLSDGIHWGSKADYNMPQERKHIFWQIMPFLDSLFTLDFTSEDFRNESPSLSDIANAHHHDRMEQFSYATLSLAAEAGAVNYLKAHPSLLTIAEECLPTCEYSPLFFYAIHRSSLLGIDWYRKAWSLPQQSCSVDATVRLLISVGCDPNNFESSSYGIHLFSPWALWLKNKHRRLGITTEEKLSALMTIEVFLDAGAMQPRISFDFMAWIREMFWDSELRGKAQTILDLYQEMMKDSTATLRQRKRYVPDMPAIHQSRRKRVCFC